MSEISHHHDDKGDDPLNYSHDTCPTCQDLLLIVESELEGCEARKFCACCDLVALNVSAKGMKSKSWWRSFWMMISFSPQEWRMNTSRHLKHKRILSTSFWLEFFVNHWEKVFRRNSAMTVIWRAGFDPFWKTSTQTRSTLISNWLPNFHNV